MPSDPARVCRAGLCRVGSGVAASLLAAWSALAQPMTRAEALAAAFPGADIRAQQMFLRPEERERAARLAGVPVPSALVMRYVAVKNGVVVGRAYVDTHVVRTKNESLLISLDASGRLRRIDLLAFLEPPEYAAPEAWLKQFAGRSLEHELALHRGIHPITGATLTARAVTEAARRVLALDRILAERREDKP